MSEDSAAALLCEGSKRGKDQSLSVTTVIAMRSVPPRGFERRELQYRILPTQANDPNHTNLTNQHKDKIRVASHSLISYLTAPAINSLGSLSVSSVPLW